ncbi:unnamed protein product [Adineta ricciae]|uniref:Uncharacterized protein n=1 Tax=Adineta ricciae TaxID=249248 RepID=A0A813TUV7_ADIRI|nr:unnamed protein product [Adineta ricciae]
MYAIAVFLTYNLQFYVPFSLLWPRLSRKVLYKYGEDTIEKFEHAFRIGLIFITCGSWKGEFDETDLEATLTSNTELPERNPSEISRSNEESKIMRETNDDLDDDWESWP